MRNIQSIFLLYIHFEVTAKVHYAVKFSNKNENTWTVYINAHDFSIDWFISARTKTVNHQYFFGNEFRTKCDDRKFDESHLGDEQMFNLKWPVIKWSGCQLESLWISAKAIQMNIAHSHITTNRRLAFRCYSHLIGVNILHHVSICSKGAN